jgi:hypothetical protein
MKTTDLKSVRAAEADDKDGMTQRNLPPIPAPEPVTAKIDVTMAWLAHKAQHIGDGLKGIGIALIGLSITNPNMLGPHSSKIAAMCYVVGMCIGKFIKPGDLTDAKPTGEAK